MTEALYIGTYTDGDTRDRGLVRAVYTPDGTSLATVSVCPVAEPSYVIAGGGVLYAVMEQQEGRIGAFGLSPDGAPRLLNSSPTGGSLPCHLALIGDLVLTADYGSGTLSVHRLAADGSLAARTDLLRHEGAEPHAHMVTPDPGGCFVLAVDLGTDSVYAYELDQRSGTLRLITQSALPSGSGPRHLACSGMRAYVVTEYASTVLTCDYQPETGALALRHEVATTSSHVENFPSAIRVSADGRFCYVANRGANTIALINTEIEPELLAEVPCGGDWPRDIALSPDGRLLFCANQRSDTVTVFRIDPRTGIPAPTGAALKVSAPTSILLAGHAGKALK